jgi:hypothetical protein
MFGSLFTSLHDFATQVLDRTPRQGFVRAASALAIAGLLLTGAPRPADAHASHNYILNFTRLDAIRESGENASDEPYVLMAVANLETGGVTIRRSNVFSGMDTGESAFQTVNLRGPAAFPDGDPSQIVVLVQFMEHDGQSDVNAIVSALNLGMDAALAGYKLLGLSRSSIVTELKGDMARIIATTAEATADAYQLAHFSLDDGNADDRIGSVQELRITSANLTSAHAGTPAIMTVSVDTTSADYRARFELRV